MFNGFGWSHHPVGSCSEHPRNTWTATAQRYAGKEDGQRVEKGAEGEGQTKGCIGLGGRQGARRWLSLGPVNLQPSEFVKLFVVLYAADYTVRKLALMHSFKRGLLPMFGVMLVVGWLLLREPDFGAFVVITAIATGILFLGGMNGTWFAGLLVMMAVVSSAWSCPPRIACSEFSASWIRGRIRSAAATSFRTP